MLAAMSGSITRGAGFTIARVASASVIECATVKAVTICTSSLKLPPRSNRPIRNAMWS
jgi:hypothetical protein